MYSAIKKRENECFMGAFQFFYNQKYKKYIPDKVIKELFNFSLLGVSLKSIKDGFSRIKWEAKIYLATKDEIPSNKWCLIMIKKKRILHYVVVKKLKYGFICFDPAIGIKKDYKLDDELIFIDVLKTSEINFNEVFDFSISKTDSLKMITFNISEVILAFIMSFYFKYALYGVENKSFLLVRKMVLVFAIVGSINVFMTYVKNMYVNKKIWNKVNSLYETFFGYILNQNIKVKNHFTKMHIYDSLQQGVDFIQFNLLYKNDFINSLMISIAAIAILFVQFKIIIVPILSIFILSSILTVAFRDKTFKNGEKIRSSEIAVANCFLKFYDNWETSTGFEKDSYKELFENSLNKNIALNYQSSKFNGWINFSFGFLSYLFNILVSAYIFIWMIKDHVSIADGIYIVTISTMLYSHLLKVWSFIFNYRLEIDSYNKFIDFVSIYSDSKTFMSYDGKRYYKNDLEGIRGHFQIKGENGTGKSTYLKMYCGLFNNTLLKRIYLSSTSSVITKPEDEMFNWLNLDEFNLEQELVSDGQRQIRNVLLALQQDFESIVLDEAMSSVALKIRNKVYNEIFKKYKDKTILIVDHDVNLKIKNIDIVL